MGTHRKITGLQRWKDWKFGLFIHWGLYSLPGGVWKDHSDAPHQGEHNAKGYAEHIQLSLKIPNEEYGKLTSQFNPSDFDPKAWVDLAKKAGMKHIVITAKHQDGFSMFNSKVSDFNIVAKTPFARDPMLELAQAARDEGLGFGFYYSQARDHHHPLANWNAYGNIWDFPKRNREDFLKYLDDKVMPQLEELLTGYGDLSVMWFDVPYEIPPDSAKKITQMVHHFQPDCVVNSRVGGEMWDYESFGDNEVPDECPGKPWETCMTTNDSWGYSKTDDHWKSSKELIRHLVDIVSKGGCFLLNIGPTGEGVIPQASQTCLKEIGDWLQSNGESIYAADSSLIEQPKWGRSTTKDKKIFLHVFDWPSSGKLDVELDPEKVIEANLLESGVSLNVSKSNRGMELDLADIEPCPACTVIALSLV